MAQGINLETKKRRKRKPLNLRKLFVLKLVYLSAMTNKLKDKQLNVLGIMRKLGGKTDENCSLEGKR